MRIIIALCLLWAGPALAVGTLDPAIASDGLLKLMRNSAATWSPILRDYATSIFWTLALIQFVWKFGMLALKQTDFAELAAEFIRWIVVIGIFAALLLNSVRWMQDIIDSFRQVGAAAAGTAKEFEPGDLFVLAIELGRTVASVGLTDPVTSFIVAISSILIVACFTFLAAFVMVTLIESYFVIHAGVFFMAFAGSEWTREYAMAMLRYAISIGAKLLVLQLIVGIIMTSARAWQAAYTHDETSMFTMLGVALMCAYFSKSLAERVQELISGVSVGGGSTLGGMAAAGLAGAAAGAAAMSATMGRASLGGTGSSVADFIKSSMSGSSGGAGATPSSFTNSGGSVSGAASRGPSPRTSGGGYAQAPGTPPSAQPSGQSSSGQSSSPSSGGSQASSASAATPMSAAAKVHAGAHMAAEAAVRTAGVLGSMSVPGMDSAHGVSIGPAPTPPDLSGATPENIIRPASSTELGHVAEASPVDTMSSTQDAINNKGNPS
jgi:type IV secretion system protein TrbL